MTRNRVINKSPFLILLIILLISGCGSYASVDIGLRKDKMQPVAQLACDRKLDDYEMHNAISRELTVRGFTVIDRSDEQFTTGEGTVVRYMDRWSWDLVMYLHDIKMRFIDGKTGAMIVNASYDQHLFHNYKSPDSAVIDVFAAIDAKAGELLPNGGRSSSGVPPEMLPPPEMTKDLHP
jgi:hypothetical protein